LCLVLEDGYSSVRYRLSDVAGEIEHQGGRQE
jgi:hypothetical protein